jgi:predicted nuclease of predicted toxin-antitoxin system
VRLLLDQGLPRSAAPELRRLGFDVEHTADIGLATATDEQVLARARADGRTVVTLDADFHALLVLSDATGPSVIRVRRQGLRGTELAQLVAGVISLCEADLAAGAMVTVDDHSVRVRALPLVRA